MSQPSRDVPREVPKTPDVVENVKNIASGIWSEQAALRTSDLKTERSITGQQPSSDSLTQQLEKIASRLNDLPQEVRNDFLKNSAYIPRDHGGTVDADKQLAVNTNLDSLKKILTTV